jgi:HSP20 family protein
LESAFSQIFGTDGEFAPAARTFESGPMAVWQDDNAIYVEVEMPGVAESDVELTVHGESLKIRAERRDEKGRTYLYNGRNSGRFARDIMLPERVDADRVEASLRNGVLYVSLPKHPSNRPRKIGLKSA